MSKHNSSRQMTNIAAAASVGIVRGGHGTEGMHKKGMYGYEILRPLPGRVDEVIALQAKIAQARQIRDFKEAIVLRDKVHALLHTVEAGDFINLVTTVGHNFDLDTLLGGSGYTAAWYIGLIGTTSYTTGPAAGDTSASHGGWAEFTGYSEGARQTPSFGAAAAGVKATSAPVEFSITSAQTVKGAFLISNSTKGGSTGTLFSAGLFSNGDKAVDNGDTLRVSYQLTQT